MKEELVSIFRATYFERSRMEWKQFRNQFISNSAVRERMG